MLLLEGDCLEKMKTIDTGSVDLILCDLPYGCTDCKWDVAIPFEDLWEEYHRILKPNGNVVLFGTEPFMSKVISSNPKEYSHQWYWKKNHKTNGINARKQPMRCIEEIAVFICNKPKGKAVSKPIYNPQGVIDLEKPRYKNERKNNQGTVYTGVKPKLYKQTKTGYPHQFLEYPTEEKRFHPTQKPVELLRYLVRTYTNRGGVVLDNCMGSGSAGVACVLEDRSFIGIEMDHKCFKIARERIENAKDIYSR